MNFKNLASIVTAGLIILGTQSVFASDFIQKQFNCPKSGAQLVGTPDGNINVEDIIISSDAEVTYKRRSQ
jgi:hypothetical protein